MGNYKIKVNTELVECPDGEGAGECLENNGSFTMTIGEKVDESIDQCESSILSTALTRQSETPWRSTSKKCL